MGFRRDSFENVREKVKAAEQEEYGHDNERLMRKIDEKMKQRENKQTQRVIETVTKIERCVK